MACGHPDGAPQQPVLRACSVRTWGKSPGVPVFKKNILEPCSNVLSENFLMVSAKA